MEQYGGLIVAFAFGCILGGVGMGIIAAAGRASLQEECQRHIEKMNQDHLEAMFEQDKRHKEAMDRLKRRKA